MPTDQVPSFYDIELNDPWREREVEKGEILSRKHLNNPFSIELIKVQ